MLAPLLLAVSTIVSAGPITLDAPSAKAIRSALERGVTFEAGENRITLGPRSKASGGGPYGASGTGRYSVKGDRVTARGSGTMACMGDEDSCSEPTLSWFFHVTFVVLAANEETLLIRIEEDSSTVVETSHEPFLIGKAPQNSGQPEVVVQLMRGAKDERLAQDAERLLSEWKADVSKRFLFVRGPKATHQRTVSEVFFGEGAEAEAKTVAGQLEPVLGTLSVKAWPGKAPVDVMVVVGDTKAK